MLYKEIAMFFEYIRKFAKAEMHFLKKVKASLLTSYLKHCSLNWSIFLQHLLNIASYLFDDAPMLANFSPFKCLTFVEWILISWQIFSRIHSWWNLMMWFLNLKNPSSKILKNLLAWKSLYHQKFLKNIWRW